VAREKSESGEIADLRYSAQIREGGHVSVNGHRICAYYTFFPCVESTHNMTRGFSAGRRLAQALRLSAPASGWKASAASPPLAARSLWHPCVAAGGAPLSLSTFASRSRVPTVPILSRSFHLGPPAAAAAAAGSGGAPGHTAVIAIGSNQGDRVELFRQALRALTSAGITGENENRPSPKQTERQEHAPHDLPPSLPSNMSLIILTWSRCVAWPPAGACQSFPCSAHLSRFVPHPHDESRA